MFSECTIISRSDSYITAASTQKDKAYGFVFMNCALKAKEGVTKAYLGRPWRPYAKTVFMKCEMGDHILPEGWKEWSNLDKVGTTFYAEYENTGPGAATENRVAWSHQLSNKEAKKYNPETILGNWITKYK